MVKEAGGGVFHSGQQWWPSLPLPLRKDRSVWLLGSFFPFSSTSIDLFQIFKSVPFIAHVLLDRYAPSNVLLTDDPQPKDTLNCSYFRLQFLINLLILPFPSTYYVLILDGSSPSLLPVTVHVVTASIKAKVPIIPYSDFADCHGGPEKFSCTVCLEYIDESSSLQFVMLFASQGRYLSRNLHQAIKNIISRTIDTIVAADGDPDSMLPDNEWFTNASEIAIKTLIGNAMLEQEQEQVTSLIALASVAE